MRSPAATGCCVPGLPVFSLRFLLLFLFLWPSFPSPFRCVRLAMWPGPRCASLTVSDVAEGDDGLVRLLTLLLEWAAGPAAVDWSLGAEEQEEADEGGGAARTASCTAGDTAHFLLTAAASLWPSALPSLDSLSPKLSAAAVADAVTAGDVSRSFRTHNADFCDRRPAEGVGSFRLPGCRFEGADDCRLRWRCAGDGCVGGRLFPPPSRRALLLRREAARGEGGGAMRIGPPRSVLHRIHSTWHASVSITSSAARALCSWHSKNDSCTHRYTSLRGTAPRGGSADVSTLLTLLW